MFNTLYPKIGLNDIDSIGTNEIERKSGKRHAPYIKFNQDNILAATVEYGLFTLSVNREFKEPGRRSDHTGRV